MIIRLFSLALLSLSFSLQCSAESPKEPNESTKILSEIITDIRGMGSYRKRALDAQVKSTVRNYATSEEAYYVDNEQYVSCTDSECAKKMPYMTLPKDISIQITATKESYKIIGKRRDGTGKTFVLDSDQGLLQELP